MGQRHQAFLIAKVVPHGGTQAYYRCIAAWHHQWCYGRLPIDATRRFINLLKQKGNAEIVSDEIASIQGKYGRFGQRPAIPKAPTPYSAFLLAQAFNIDLQDPSEPYFSGVSFSNALLHAGMGSFAGDNNDGITIIDVTEPSDVGYCYAYASSRKPLSAADYAGSSDGESLKDTRLLSLEVLAEAWPHEYKLKNVPASSTEPSLVSPTSIPRLAELTIGPAVEAAIANNDTQELGKLIWMPDKLPLIRAALQNFSSLPDAAIPVITEIVRCDLESTDDDVVDLSGFALNCEQIIRIVLAFREKGPSTLNLSGIPSVTIDTVTAVILHLQESLRRLVLLRTNVTCDELATSIVANPGTYCTLEDLVHPYIYSLDKGNNYVNAFSFCDLTNISNPSISSIPLLHPPQVVQALTDALLPFTEAENGIYLSSAGQSALFPQTALATGVRAAGQPWGERRVAFFPTASTSALEGAGWCFFLKLDAMALMGMRMMLAGGQSAPFYGFVKVDPSGSNTRICNLDQFLKEMEEEGRPLPSNDAINKLSEILGQLEATQDVSLVTKDQLRTAWGRLRVSQMYGQAM